MPHPSFVQSLGLCLLWELHVLGAKSPTCRSDPIQTNPLRPTKSMPPESLPETMREIVRGILRYLVVHPPASNTLGRGPQWMMT